MGWNENQMTAEFWVEKNISCLNYLHWEGYCGADREFPDWLMWELLYNISIEWREL